MQRRIQRYGWDAAAEIYDSSWRQNLGKVHEVMLDMSTLQPDDDVLEVAAGTGFLTFKITEILNGRGRITATDISQTMVDVLERRAQDNSNLNLTAIRSDAEALSFSDHAFDHVFCALGLMYMPDPVSALHRMCEALKPGGRIVVGVWGARKNCAWAEIFSVIDEEVQSDTCPLFFRLGGEGALNAAMNDAGFKAVSVRRVNIKFRFHNTPELLEAMINGGPVALAAKRFNEATRERVDTRYLESLNGFKLDDGGWEIPSEFVVATGIKPSG